jgi:glutamine synthetase
MAILRFKALEELHTRAPLSVENPGKVSTFYGENVFHRDTMREFLQEDIFEKVMEAVELGTQLDRKIADAVATGMKAWALSKGVSHYTHWFQPLTGTTAEKHDGFFQPVDSCRAIEAFEGKQLIQQEPDASSFPNGGIRNTFEARGYSAWDPSSPAFIIGSTLCIPTIFISYTGESLDYKAPLLKTLSALDKAATDVCQYFDKNVTKVVATLGWEQEYFLIDEALYNARPDLVMTGRTVFGHSPAKGQQLEDHYFGSIPERVMSFMRDFENESLKLGIPVRTRHNEVAPNQFECAPVFEEVNIANDHNLLLMDLMDKIARKHNFRVLFHEKPFAGVNGSGKHNNWSMGTNTGKNLLSPGKTPKTNLQFLTFFVNTIKAVYEHDDLLRASIASAGNDHRLGANEAPPAIISAFLGSQLTAVLDELVSKVKKGKLSPEEKTDLKLNIGKIPEILLDNTDRNRTSPFAFTGNKFEFRAVGSSANCAQAMVAINSAVTAQLIDFKKDVDALISKGEKKDDAILKVLKQYIETSSRIRFEGNGYSEEWVVEAEKRGLNNIKTTPQALDALVSKKTVALWTKLGVFNEREIHARHDIYLENYMKKIQIEGRVVGDLALNHIIPTAIEYQNKLIENVKGLKELYGAGFKKLAEVQLSTIEEISERISKISKNVEAMTEERKKANGLSDARKQAIAYCDKVFPYFEKIRYEVDKLELLVSDEAWPLPKYREMLFHR